MLMAMAAALPPCNHLLNDDDDDDKKYIDMDLSSTNAAAAASSPQFEFKMCHKGAEREPAFSSPADELFYKGKLLPLLLPPRLRMVGNLLESPVTTTPATLADRNGSRKMKAFSEKWKLKLKASQSYLKGLFARDPQEAVEEEELVCRRSFSGGAIARNSTAKSPSSSCSSSFSAAAASSSFSCLSSQIVLRRSSSASSEMENLILGAIAYCKESQQQSDVRMRSVAAIARELQERPRPRPCHSTTK